MSPPAVKTRGSAQKAELKFTFKGDFVLPFFALFLFGPLFFSGQFCGQFLLKWMGIGGMPTTADQLAGLSIWPVYLV
jgi:hypothetical protein